MKKRVSIREISVEIDKLTNSIENAISGDVFDTEFHRLTKADKKSIKKSEWLFDWKAEIDNKEHEVYKLTIKGNSDVIQGLISLNVEDNYVFIHLVENAKFNRGKKYNDGKEKIYVGVSGNMFAFACKKSSDLGFAGFVAFIAKTALIDHYIQTLGAESAIGQRMYIGGEKSDILIKKYFKS
jgi:hypothetical protein